MTNITRTIEFKLYLNASQEATLTEWLRTCCWVYNQALEHRIKAYKRRGDSPTRYDQQMLLTLWRARIDDLRSTPVHFERAALRRLDRAFDAFFRRCKAGDKPGFPRFRSHHRSNSLECLVLDNYASDGTIRIPKIGKVIARGQFPLTGRQKLLRVIRRASGWYAQVVVDQGPVPAAKEPQTFIGVDMGLNHFAALSNGETIPNPRLFRQSEHKLKSRQRNVSRKRKGSCNRRKAIRRLAPMALLSSVSGEGE